MQQKAQILQHIIENIDKYNKYDELYQKQMEALKQIGATLKSLDNQLNKLIDEYNLAAEQE